MDRYSTKPIPFISLCKRQNRRSEVTESVHEVRTASESITSFLENAKDSFVAKLG
jgi:hypothetical protein